MLVGSMGYGPMGDSARWMINEVMPLIRKAEPTAMLDVIGAGSKELPDGPGVCRHGFVENLKEAYDMTAISVCPIIAGRGAQVKVAEAAMMGQAIVATPMAARGFAGILEPGRDLVVAEDALGFARATVDLLRDPATTRRLGDSAREQALINLSQKRINEIVYHAAASARSSWVKTRGAKPTPTS